MNIISENLYYKDFRNLIAYQKMLNIIEMIFRDKDIKNFDEAKGIKQLIRIATEIAKANGSLLTDKGQEYHYRRAIYNIIRVKEHYGDDKVLIKKINEIEKIIHAYKKNIRGKGEQQMKKVKSDTLDIKYVQRRIDSLKDFRYLKGYQIALEFYKKLYEVISELPFYEQYGIFDQLDRASMSIVANLAEGNENIYDLKKVNFYAIALATSNECQCWLDIMYIKKYITKEKHHELDSMLVEIKNLIIAYIKAVNTEKVA